MLTDDKNTGFRELEQQHACEARRPTSSVCVVRSMTSRAAAMAVFTCRSPPTAPTAIVSCVGYIHHNIAA